MGRIRVVTDSTADIPPEILKAMDITMVPLKVHFGDEAYLDYVEMTPAQFYRKLAASREMPRTSQPSPGDFAEVYRKLSADGSAIVSIHLSSKLSGTFQSAVLAKEIVPEARVEVIDSRSASMGLGLMVLAAAGEASRLGESDRSAEECLAAVTARAESVRRNMKLYFAVDTLDYLRANGRIGRAQHLLGSLLNFKPVLTIDDEGYVSSYDKVRGKSRAVSRLAELFREGVPEGATIDIAVVHSVAEDEAKGILSDLSSSYNIRKGIIGDLGAVIGTHVGPGTVAVMGYDVSVVEGTSSVVQ